MSWEIRADSAVPHGAAFCPLFLVRLSKGVLLPWAYHLKLLPVIVGCLSPVVCMRSCARSVLTAYRSFATQPVLRSSNPTTILDRPSSYDLEEIFDSFDDAEAQRHLSPSSFPSTSSSPSESISRNRQLSQTELSAGQLKRRRDTVNKSLELFGSLPGESYSPRKLLHSPPSIHDIGIDTLVASQAHMGHSTALWNPITQPYIYGSRNGIHIFNLDLTLAHLRRAAEVIHGVAQNDGNILFVGTRPGQKRTVVEASKRAGGYHVFDRWIPGTITNGKQVVGHGLVKSLITKHKQNKNPPSNPSTAPNSVVPDLVVVLNPLENRNLLKECAKGRVPTIGIIDSDADPRWVTYCIPANDDSLRCTSLIAGMLSRAAAAGRAKMAIDDWEQVETQ